MKWILSLLGGVALIVLIFQQKDKSITSNKLEIFNNTVSQSQAETKQHMLKRQSDNTDNEIDKLYYAAQIDLQQEKIDTSKKRINELTERKAVLDKDDREKYEALNQAAEIKGKEIEGASDLKNLGISMTSLNEVEEDLVEIK